MSILDAQRFGTFSYDTYSEVQDFRIERYLPTSAREISLDKFAMEHRAKYTITKTELTTYLDALLLKAGKYSAVSREELDEGASVSFDRIAYDFEGLGWPRLSTVMRFHSPIQGDGGGATYYFDPSKTSCTTERDTGSNELRAGAKLVVLTSRMDADITGSSDVDCSLTRCGFLLGFGCVRQRKQCCVHKKTLFAFHLHFTRAMK